MFAQVITVFGALTIFAVVTSLMIWAALAIPAGRLLLGRWFGRGGRELLLGAWFVAAAAMAGSLYFSGSGLEPCRYCWYQRIAMYPLVFVVGVAVLQKDVKVWRYVLPLSVGGMLLSIYHAALQLQPALEVTQCAATAPCTLRYFAVWGWISIPWMAGAAFLWVTTLVSAAAILSRRPTDGTAPPPARP